jgi:L,D-peptidoglycan transpeptidase YkuD (ErfK/YbiS/YcfS/YnhG family)
MSKHLLIKTQKREISCGNLNLPCRIGRAGAVRYLDGREGDAKTPLGDYHLRFGLYRADRLPRPQSKLTFRPLRHDDGWCDEPVDPAYNRFIRLPSSASHEALWRDDGAYDIILVMSHNDSPPVPKLGSAVFIHVAQPDDRQTLGCVALAPEVMVRLLPRLYMDQTVHIST